MTRYILALFLCLFALAPAPLMAQTEAPAPGSVQIPYPCSYTPDTCPPPIGTIAEIEGQAAFVAHDELPADAKKGFIPTVGQEVYVGDSIVTGNDSKVLILFIDDTDLTIASNASMTIDEYVFDESDPAMNKGHFSILRGAFLFATGLIDKIPNPDVQITTEYGSIGIRGTVVWGGEIDDEYNVFVQEGAVNFATERGRVTVGEGQGTKVHSRRDIPGRANAWGQEKIGRAVNMVALKNADAVKARVTQIKAHHTDMRRDHADAVHGHIQKRQDRKIEERRQLHEQREQRQQEHRPTPQEMDDKGAQTQQRQTERLQRLQEMHTDTPARDMEQNEKMHLQESIKENSEENNAAPATKTTPTPQRRRNRSQ